MKKYLFALLICLSGFILVGCSDDENESGKGSGKSELTFDGNSVGLDSEDVAYWYKNGGYVNLTLSIVRPDNPADMDLRYLFNLSHSFDIDDYSKQIGQNLLKDSHNTDCELGGMLPSSGEIIVTGVDIESKMISYEVKSVKFESHTLNGKFTLPFTYRN